jgi:2',3'-cyclic-nucleotide 2'-phosphodiesterase (5'-nucleotidase family)
MSNLIEIDKNNRPIAGAKPYHIIQRDGLRVGVIGTCDKGWMDCLIPDIDCKNLKVIDPNESAEHFAKLLRN